MTYTAVPETHGIDINNMRRYYYTIDYRLMIFTLFFKIKPSTTVTVQDDFCVEKTPRACGLDLPSPKVNPDVHIITRIDAGIITGRTANKPNCSFKLIFHQNPVVDPIKRTSSTRE